MLASDRPARGWIGQDDQIQPLERLRRYAAAPTGPDAGAALLGRARFRRRQRRVRPRRLSGAGMAAMASPRPMVMLAMPFIVEQRVAQQPGLELLTPRDIVEMLKETLPRKPDGREALVARINERHARRRGAIESRFRNQHKRDSG